MKKLLILLALVSTTNLFAQKCDVSCLAFDFKKTTYDMSYEEYLENSFGLVLRIKNNCAEACTYRFGHIPLVTTEYGLSPLVCEVYQLIDGKQKLMYVMGNDTHCALLVEDPVTGEVNVDLYPNELLKGMQAHEKEVRLYSLVQINPDTGEPIYNKSEKVKYLFKCFYRYIRNCADNITCEDHIPLPEVTLTLH